MLIVQKNSAINSTAIALMQGRKVLNTKDTPRVQKWIVNSLRNAGYIGKSEEGHLFGYDKYVFTVDNPRDKQFTVKGVCLQAISNVEEIVVSDTDEFANDEKEAMPLESNTKKLVSITDHAIREALKDFPELETKSNAEVWIRNGYKKAKLIDESTVGIDGKVRSMYCFQNTSFIVQKYEDEDIIITVFKVKRQTSEVKEMIRVFLTGELKKLQNKENRIKKRNNLRVAELTLEKAEQQLKAVKTRSETVKKSCFSRISEIDNEISLLQKEMYEILREKTNISRGLVFHA